MADLFVGSKTRLIIVHEELQMLKCLMGYMLKRLTGAVNGFIPFPTSREDEPTWSVSQNPVGGL